MSSNKILMIHFRVGKTDGVSIEMNSWRKMLESNGNEVRYCAGPESIGSEYVVEHMEQQLNEKIFTLDQDSFNGFKNFKNEKEFIDEFNEISNRIEKDLTKVFDDYDPTDVIISNMFSVGEGLPTVRALVKVLDQYKPNTIVINHDFYWEESRYDEPSCDFIREYLEEYLPPVRDYIQYCTINSIAQKSLKKEKGIESEVFYDTFDFINSIWRKRNSITKLLEESGIQEDTFVFLQATRIVRRKNIELSIDLVREFTEKVATTDIEFPYRKIVLLLAGYVEKRDEEYLERLFKHAKDSNVEMVYIGDRMHIDYELFDIYPYGDVITYPSEYEGFGNQLLEAFNIKKPIVVFEYPVYKSDIKHLGFEVISLGDQLAGERENGLKFVEDEKLETAVSHLIEILEDDNKLDDLTDNNKSLAHENFGYHVTERKLIKLLDL